ncbi:NAD(P)H-dependent oxidoreductase [Zhihengliuella halotolerans]|uniref:NAD(P)H dehydrogenase (Quinone) n=1 Tax=Zhihengliuella halotolerans TaxID=370736 RepID=A0A4Q8AAL8_9MICC|nr:NAD(P)H-dependent oxidoreductase [Zhihengliuella halotolerans]RZU61162.1 NAD(P)H dehydrogenase (quinone) [Zhihengliuella halotolerans]
MTTDTGRRPAALIVHAHPERASFNTAQARIAQSALEERGYSVEFIDLYERSWSPVLDRSEFPASERPFKPQQAQLDAFEADTLAPEVRGDLDALLGADLLVLSFPLWWFSVPAVLKGWLDRVLIMGATFGGKHGLYEQAAMTGRRAVLLTTTGGSPASFERGGAFGDINDFLFHIHRGVLEFVGYDALQPIITYGPAHLEHAARVQALEGIREAFLNLSDRPLVRSSRAHPPVAVG